MKTLSDIIGHERARGVLAASVRSGRVHHAWIFHGPAGVGKRTCAEAFGLALLDDTTRVCEGEIVSDEQSPARRLADSGVHPDLHVVTKELARFSDDPQIRSRKLTSIPREVLVERVIEPASQSSQLRTAAVARKVFVIDEAELMNDAGQNALLKTLEEPPEGTVLVLVTASEDRLLPTIRSRCQRVGFGPLSEAEMAAWAAREGFDAPGALALAGGSPGAAVMVRDGGLEGWLTELEPMLRDAARGVFLPELGGTLRTLIDTWAKNEVSAHEGASKDAANKAGARTMFWLLTERVRRELRAAAAEGVDAGRARIEERVRELACLGEAELDVARNVNLQLAMENLAAQLSTPGARA